MVLCAFVLMHLINAGVLLFQPRAFKGVEGSSPPTLSHGP